MARLASYVYDVTQG